MKRIISLITVFILTSVTAFASDAEDIAALFDKSGKLHSASVEMTFKTDVNKPLDIISQIPDSEDQFSDINPQMIIESLIGTEMKLNCTYSASEDYNKMLADMSVEFDAPVQLNENLKISAWAKIGIWVDYDFTDKENPVYRTIIKNPIDKKYDVMDMSGYFKENPDKMPEINADTVKELQKKAMAALLDNAEITKAKGVYTIKLTDETAKEYMKDVMSLAKEFMPEDPEADEAVSQLLNFFERVNIFGKNGITMTVSPNAAGYIAAEATDMHINMNVYDAITEYGGNTEGLDRDKANIDLTVKAECKYTNHNSAVPVLPEITEENSYIIDYNHNSYSYDDTGIKRWAWYEGEEDIIWKDKVAYYPYEDMARQIGLDLRTEVKDDIITISSGESYHVDVKGNEITLYGDTVTAAFTPMVSENGRWYCTYDFLYYLGMDTYSMMEYDIESNRVKYEFWYDGLPEDWQDDDEIDYEKYNPYENKVYYYVNSDRALYCENDTAYVPIYDLLYEISPGEYSFSNNGFEYKAGWKNALGIDTASVYPGDKFITVNGEQKELPYEVVDIDGVMRVPVAFADSIGLDLYSIRLHSYGSRTSFSFRRSNVDEPDYDDYYDYHDNTPDNWFESLMHSF